MKKRVKPFMLVSILLLLVLCIGCGSGDEINGSSSSDSSSSDSLFAYAPDTLDLDYLNEAMKAAVVERWQDNVFADADGLDLDTDEEKASITLHDVYVPSTFNLERNYNSDLVVRYTFKLDGNKGDLSSVHFYYTFDEDDSFSRDRIYVKRFLSDEAYEFFEYLYENRGKIRLKTTEQCIVYAPRIEAARDDSMLWFSKETIDDELSRLAGE